MSGGCSRRRRQLFGGLGTAGGAIAEGLGAASPEPGCGARQPCVGGGPGRRRRVCGAGGGQSRAPHAGGPMPGTRGALGELGFSYSSSCPYSDLRAAPGVPGGPAQLTPGFQTPTLRVSSSTGLLKSVFWVVEGNAAPASHVAGRVTASARAGARLVGLDSLPRNSRPSAPRLMLALSHPTFRLVRTAS